MNLFPNPIFLLYLTKHSLSVNRLWKLDKEKLEIFQIKAMKEMLSYAEKTKLYKDKLKQSKISSKNFKKIEDIYQIPFVSKQDLRDYGINGTLPKKFNVDKGFKVDTSGSTGKPVSIYRDLNSLALEFTVASRMLKAHNLSSIKTRITNIGDFSIPNSHDEECINKGVYRQMGFLCNIFFRNVQNLYAGKEIKNLIVELSNFKPNFIIAYPGTLIGLMKLRQEGYGVDFNPSHIVVSGGMLDNYTKKQIENTFDAKVFSLYAATESGAVAFECSHGNYHVQSDMVFIEAIDENGNHVKNDDHGHIVVSRLYGRGTPIIRYTGMDDIITPIESESECDCGMNTPFLKNVEGRSKDSIVLPDGRIFPAATFTLIPGEVAQDFKIDIIQQFQIIQNKKDELEILIVINKNIKDNFSLIDGLLNEIKIRYQKLVGKDVLINVKEVEKVKVDSKYPDSYSSIVISNVNQNDWL